MIATTITPQVEQGFLRNLLHAERRYTIVEAVDIKNTIAMILKKDFKNAVSFYLNKYSSVPEMCILDMDKNTLQEIKELNLNFRVTILSPQQIRRLLLKKLCLWIDPLMDNEPGPGSSSLLVGIRRMDDYGFKNYLIDKHSFSLFKLNYGDFYTPPLALHTFNQHLHDAINIYHSLEDEASKNIFIGALRARLEGDFSYFQRSKYPEYTHPQCKVEPGDIMIDGGIWDSRVVGKFSSVIGNKGHIYAFEPLPHAYARTKEQIKSLDNITLENLGLAKEEGQFYITLQGEGSHLVSCAVNGAERCRVIDIDSYMKSHSNIKRIDMIKLDIEGAEPDAIQGALETIKKYKPKLAISIYHTPIHQLIQIPSMILNLNLGYKLWMGHHTEVCFGTILYAKV